MAGCILFVRKEYQLSAAASPPPADASTAQVSAPEPVPSSSTPLSAATYEASAPPTLYDTPATEEVPRRRSATDDEILAHAKDAPVSMLDSSLPHQSAGYWIAHAAGPSAGLRWEVNNCPGARRRRDTRPLCAEAHVRFLNGTKFNALLLVGEQPLKPPGPIRYGQPSLLWAAYKKYRGPIVPASLSLLPRIAEQAD